MIGKGKSVLVVDPDDSVRQMLGAALRDFRFDRVTSVETIDKAKEALGPGGLFDLALIAWDVGTQSGFDLAADIRTGRVIPRRDLPIIMMAWKAEPKRGLAAQGLKVNGMLIKPLARDILEKKIVSALAVQPKAAPKRLMGQAS